MLCCLSKRAVEGDHESSYDSPPLKTEPSELEKSNPESSPKDVPPILLPCAICARTFMPQSLEKHTRVCERTASKKRKPFDSAKQRIQGTDLAEFLPKQEKKRHYIDERVSKPKTSWKQNHDDFLQAIRAARNEIVEPPGQRQCRSVTSGAPTRSNEQGMCPTCNRHFGIKAYDRHVTWCKERSTRVVLSPATNVAKERLEARMKYRAPTLKTRRAINREKYSPGSATILSSKTSPVLSSTKAKESVSTPSCNRSNDTLIKQKPGVVRRLGEAKETSSPTGPMKSRLADRMDRLREEEFALLSPKNLHPIKKMSYLPVPPLRPKKEVFEDRGNVILLQKYYKLQNGKTDDVEHGEVHHHSRTEDKLHSSHSARSQKMNIVSARSQGNPKVNDVTVNAEITGLVVQPCTIYHQDKFITWKQISRGKDFINNNIDRNHHKSDVLILPDAEAEADVYFRKGSVESSCASLQNMKEEELSSGEKLYTAKSSLDGDNFDWSADDTLNETYLLNDISLDVSGDMWKPVRHSPRIEFCLPPPEMKKSDVSEVKMRSLAKNIVRSSVKENEISSASQKCIRNTASLDMTVKETLKGLYSEEGSEREDEFMRLACQNICTEKNHSTESLNMIVSQNEVHDSKSSNVLSVDIITNRARSSTPLNDSLIQQIEGVNDINDTIVDPSVDSTKEACITSTICNENFKTSVTNTNESQMKEENNDKQPLEIAIQVNICPCVLELAKNSTVDWQQKCEACDSVNTESAVTGQNTQQEVVVEISEDTCNFNSVNTNTNDSNQEQSSQFLTGKEKVLIDTEIHTSYINKDFEYDSDHLTTEGQVSQTDLPKLVVNDQLKSDDLKMSSSQMKLNRRPKSTGSTKLRIQESMNAAEEKLRQSLQLPHKSTNSLVSSEAGINTVITRDANCSEIETIEEISTLDKAYRLNILPNINRSLSDMKKNCTGKKKVNRQAYWDQSVKLLKSRLINLDLPSEGETRLFERNPKLRILPPVPHTPPSLRISGTLKDYNPFLLAEQQMNDLLSDTSEPSVTDSPAIKNTDTLFPLSPSSAFVKYPYHTSSTTAGKRTSLIAPPSEFDDLTSDFSSDSTETNSLSREVFLKDLKENKEFKDSLSKSVEEKSPTRELGRRVIIDKSKALGGEVGGDYGNRSNKTFIGNSEKSRKVLGKVSPKIVRPAVNRSLSVRAASAPKPTAERKNSDSNLNNVKKLSQNKTESQKVSNTSLNNRNNNYDALSSSNLSLSSIVSSEVDMKRSISVFEELMTSFEEENGPFPSLRSLLKNDSLSISSPVPDIRQRNGQISDEELSSPENYKRQDHSKHSADSAYSSLNRKYSHHGRNGNDIPGRLEEDPVRSHRRDSGEGSANKHKMPKYCHNCGTKFPEIAKFCCECGLQRLAL